MQLRKASEQSVFLFVRRVISSANSRICWGSSTIECHLSIVDEWCCGYVEGLALDSLGWQPLIEARPDWFEIIHLYGTKSGWDRLKELVDAHEDAIARHQVFVDMIAPGCTQHSCVLACSPCSRSRSHSRSATADPQDSLGRNNLCPCGSGKKFKRCHGAPSKTAH